MVDWRSPAHLARHFALHARRLRLRTIASYDASARDTIERGTYLEYRDRGSGDARVGYYHVAGQRFTALTYDQTTILTHYRCSEQYVRDNLIGSTYA